MFDVLCVQEITRGFHESEGAGGLAGGPSPDQFAELARLLPDAVVIDAIGSYCRMLEPIANAPSFVDAWACAHGNAPRAATVDFVFVTEDLRPRIVGCEVDLTSRSSDHQPLWLELG